MKNMVRIKTSVALSSFREGHAALGLLAWYRAARSSVALYLETCAIFLSAQGISEMHVEKARRENKACLISGFCAQGRRLSGISAIRAHACLTRLTGRESGRKVKGLWILKTPERMSLLERFTQPQEMTDFSGLNAVVQTHLITVLQNGCDTAWVDVDGSLTKGNR